MGRAGEPGALVDPDVAPMTNAPAGQSVDASHQARPLATPARKVYMIGNAHIDPVWLWPWQEGYQEARATFVSVLDRMDEYPDFVFTCDQSVLLSWIGESAPEVFERIRQRVKEGRWVNTGGWWVEPDCNMPAGESFVRQGLYGQRFLERAFGQRATVGMNVDPFGHNAMIPQILRGQGMDSYTFLRPGPHEAALPPIFWWESPDGSRVLAYRIPFEYCSDDGEISHQTEKAIAQIDQRLGDLMVFYGVGNHGGGPTKANIDSIHRYDVMGTFGQMGMTSPVEFFADFRKSHTAAELANLPVVSGDLQHHAPGAYSAQSMIKKEQRRAQHAVLTAERWATIGNCVEKFDYPAADLENAWKQVLFNQFHDILPGAAIEPSYIDARDQLGEAVAISKRVITRVHNRIARRIDIPYEDGTYPLAVFNPHPWPVSSDVEMQYLGDLRGTHVVDAVGGPIPSQVIRPLAATKARGGTALLFRSEVPACGYRLYRIRPGETAWPMEEGTAVRAVGLRLENEFLRIDLDPSNGWLSGLLDKETGLDVVAGAVGEHTIISQDPTDTWGHHVVSYAGPGTPMRLTSINLDESGPLRASLIVTREWGRSTLRERFTLAAGERHVDVAVTLDWREPGHLLKLRFPVKLTGPQATFEIPFGHLERPTNGAEEPGQSWVDVTGQTEGGRAGLAVVNDAKHGYDVSPADQPRGASPSMGITAVRSPVYSWHDPLILDESDQYVHQDQGIQHFTLRLLPHGPDWSPAQLARSAAELGQRQRAMMEGSHVGDFPPQRSFVKSTDPGVLISALKSAEDSSGDVILRAVERDGVTHMGVVLDFPVTGCSVTADFSPFQIRTFRLLADSTVRETNLLEEPNDGDPGSNHTGVDVGS